jgi:hypothetical protein
MLSNNFLMVSRMLDKKPVAKKESKPIHGVRPLKETKSKPKKK